MRFTRYLLLFIIITSVIGCGLECADKKTGLSKSSSNIKDSKKNNLFNFSLNYDTKTLVIDSERVFHIKNAWVENCWSYECISNRAVLVKKKTHQFIIDYEYKSPKYDSISFCLWKLDEKHGSCLGGIMKFNYNGEDTLKLVLRDDGRRELDTLKFWKNK